MPSKNDSSNVKQLPLGELPRMVLDEAAQSTVTLCQSQPVWASNILIDLGERKCTN
jgi:hypothetical protein